MTDRYTVTLDPFAYLALILSGSLDLFYLICNFLSHPFYLAIFHILALHNSRRRATYKGHWLVWLNISGLWTLQSSVHWLGYSMFGVRPLSHHWYVVYVQERPTTLKDSVCDQHLCHLSPSFELKYSEISQTSYSILISHTDLLSFSILLQMWNYSRLSDLLHPFSM